MDTSNKYFSELLQTTHIVPPATGSSHINVSKPERIASAVGGTLLTYYGLKKPNLIGLILAAAGGAMLYRSATGYCAVNKAIGRDTGENEDISVEITRTVTVNKPRSEVYQFWRQLENLPTFMEHLESVRQLGPKRSQWSARIPGGIGTINWDADIVQEVPDELIAWQSLPAADIDNAGEVRFSDDAAGKETIVQVTISYRPPAGSMGGMAAKLLNPMLKKMVEKDIRRFKRLLETGEVTFEPSATL
ncbi:DUF2892 domain-containing protein [Pontibacter qinzhouensis]|uniref:DUF2892 domain-containing protein n=1 Tax=Pontibacter qinzhouensis TaxID=2603253 RepID=A0A5C8KEC8_9BACT|nr:SRPBCC family protein [Pontibacter qinzhouensis]TXK52416.1 DUF2892 domain-containing protein [Pontibacter qinzhouensis]